MQALMKLSVLIQGMYFCMNEIRVDCGLALLGKVPPKIPHDH